MSKALFPIPVTTPIMQNAGGNQFSIAWQKYLKAVGDDLLTANLVKDVTELVQDPNFPLDPTKKISVNTGLKYTVNANICACTFDKQLAADKELVLPYTSLLGFAVGSTVYPAGTKRIIIPASTAFVQFWYVVDFNV